MARREPERNDTSNIPVADGEIGTLAIADASRQSKYLNDAPSSENEMLQTTATPHLPSNAIEDSETSVTKPESNRFMSLPGWENITMSGDPSLINLFNNRWASSVDVNIYLMAVRVFGVEMANQLARDFNWEINS